MLFRSPPPHQCYWKKKKRGANKVCRETDGLQSVIIELQSAPIIVSGADKMENERRNKEVMAIVDNSLTSLENTSLTKF